MNELSLTWFTLGLMLFGFWLAFQLGRYYERSNRRR